MMNEPIGTDESASASAGDLTSDIAEARTSPQEPFDATRLSIAQSTDVDAGAGAGVDGDTAPLPHMSKSQLKKRNRWQKSQAIKQRRKEQSRQVKRLRALKEGRDLDAERQQQALNEQDGSGRAKREEKWKQIMQKANIENSFRVCFDCVFEDQMTYKETNSLSLQLRYTYAKNRRSSMPVYIDVCGLSTGCKTREHLENVEGFPDAWVGRAFRCHEGGLEAVYGSYLTSSTAANVAIDRVGSECDNTTIQALTNLPPNHKLVYLTGDSPNTLTTLDDNTTYIIGGIVDRNRLKFAAIERAASINATHPLLNIQTARLPLDEHIDFKGSTRILTCNHVFEILQRYRENGYTDWRASIMAVLPCRKDVEERNEEANGEVDNQTTTAYDEEKGA
jgi:tRNA (guanine9-N1)-methyltransferase